MHISKLVSADPEYLAARQQQAIASAKLAEAKDEFDKAVEAVSAAQCEAETRAYQTLYLSQPADVREVIRGQRAPTDQQRDLLIRLGFWHAGGSSYDGGHPPGPVSLQPSRETYWRWEMEKIATSRDKLPVTIVAVEAAEAPAPEPKDVETILAELQAEGWPVETT